jgi:hypothetical protein
MRIICAVSGEIRWGSNTVIISTREAEAGFYDCRSFAKQRFVEGVNPHSPEKIKRVELLGYHGSLKWVQEAIGLRVQMPAEKPCDHAVALKVTFA